MSEGFDIECKEALMEMRSLLKEIDQKISHLLEQNKFDEKIYWYSGN